MDKKLKKFPELYFWEPSLSPHRADFVCEVSKLWPNSKIFYMAAEGLLENRKNMGWSVNEAKEYTTIIRPSDEEIRKAFECKDALHIFSGIRNVEMLVRAISFAKKTNAKFAIHSEPRSGSGAIWLMKYFQSWLFERFFRKKCAFVLAVGANGPSWFLSTGYSFKKVFYFAYFINAPQFLKVNLNSENIKICYVGRIVGDKGVFDLVDAVKGLNNYELDFIGGGADEADLRIYSEGLPIKFLGIKKISEVPKIISHYDVLVLPSKVKDGWGVVVSEALMCGLPVIATPHVGASLVLKDSLMGRVVAANSPSEIRGAILNLKNESAFSPEICNKRKTKAISMLSAEAGAKYFVSIINNTYSIEPINLNYFNV